MEKLAIYMARHDLTQGELGRKLGLHQSSLSKMLRGKFQPSLETALEIERLTKGEVPVESWAPFARLSERKHGLNSSVTREAS